MKIDEEWLCNNSDTKISDPQTSEQTFVGG